MTTPAATVNFILYPHATFTESMVLRDADNEVVDLTGYSGRAQVRREISDEDPVFDLSSVNGGIVLGGAAGTIALQISAADTAEPDVEWEGEYWVYDLLLTNPDGDVERTVQGSISALPGVTRP